MLNNQFSFTNAELYDIFNSKCTEDVSMYLELCSNAHTVLELGIGTGRIAIPLAKAGIDVVGVDNSTTMLDSLQKKIKKNACHNIKVINQDMCKLDLKQSFDYVICPFCTFNFLLTLDEQESALSALRKHLTTKSDIIFDLMTPYTFPYVMQECNNLFFDSVGVEDNVVEIYVNSQFNQQNQIFTQERNFKIRNRNTLISEKQTIMYNRIFLLGEFKLLLEKCGFRIINIWGDYKLSPFKNDSKNLIVSASPY